MERTCKDCLTEKPLDQFATYKRKGEIKYLYRCKACQKPIDLERQRRYVEKNREAHNKRVRDNKRKRYQTDPKAREKMKAASAAYYEANRESQCNRQYLYYHENREEILARQQEKRDADNFRPKIRVQREDPTFEDVLEQVRSGSDVVL
jgi:hypothetical protein